MVCNLREFKEFMDNEMIVILGQMDSPTEIFDHVYLVGCLLDLHGRDFYLALTDSNALHCVFDPKHSNVCHSCQIFMMYVGLQHFSKYSCYNRNFIFLLK